MNNPIQILYLEDNPRDAELVQDKLNSTTGVTWMLTVASNRAEYEAALAQAQYDLILADYSLPDYDGRSALALARTMQPHVPVILLSGTLGEEEAVDCMLNGATDFVLKQRPDRLVPAVLRALSEAEGHQKRRTAETALTRLAMAVEQAAEIIMVTDVTGAIIYVNPAFAKTTGYSCAEALGQTPRILKSGKQDAAFYRQMWSSLVAGKIWKGHLVNKRKDGTFFEEEASISPVLDPTGKIVNYVGVKRDVTREVQLEKQFLQTQKLEAVGQLAGGVAHDFNNKLHIILSCVESILQHFPSDHPIMSDLRDIKTAARQSADLTRQLLAFSRRQPIVPVVLDVNEAITSSLKMLSRLLGENIALDFKAQSGLWCAFMDPGQLDQVLVNLAVNARDAIADTGRISIEVANVTLLESDCRGQSDFVAPGDYVLLTFRDDGEGMSPEIQTHLFEPFFTTKGVGKGTGLGLATVYGIVNQNQGAITVQSAPGQGTTFSIYLPRAPLAAHRESLKSKKPISSGTETVLVVEDEEGVLRLAQRNLIQHGYKVLTANAPDAALRLCEQYPEPIHLMLSDVIMPGMGGRELSECIRKLRPSIRVLFMSGYPSDITEQFGMLAANVELLHKPFTSDELARHVREVLDHPDAPIM